MNPEQIVIRKDFALPQLRSKEDLALLLDLKNDELDDLLTTKDKNYSVIAIPKKGKLKKTNPRHSRKSVYPSFPCQQSEKNTRLLHIPSPKLMRIQRTILYLILPQFPISPRATAYIPGKSLAHNVEPHVNHRYFLCLDLSDFFGSITTEKIVKLFEALPYSKEITQILAELCTVENHIPQGGPSSAYISNLVMKPIDDELSRICSQEIAYTRYADDMTFSSSSIRMLRPLTPLVDYLIRHHGFAINWCKFHIVGPRRRCEITGLIKNSSRAQFGIGKNAKRHMRAIMFAATQNVFNDSKFPTVTSIQGWLAYLASVDHTSYIQMYNYWIRIANRFAHSQILSTKRIYLEKERLQKRAVSLNFSDIRM